METTHSANRDRTGKSRQVENLQPKQPGALLRARNLTTVPKTQRESERSEEQNDVQMTRSEWRKKRRDDARRYEWRRARGEVRSVQKQEWKRRRTEKWLERKEKKRKLAYIGGQETKCMYERNESARNAYQSMNERNEGEGSARRSEGDGEKKGRKQSLLNAIWVVECGNNDRETMTIFFK